MHDDLCGYLNSFRWFPQRAMVKQGAALWVHEIHRIAHSIKLKSSSYASLPHLWNTAVALCSVASVHVCIPGNETAAFSVGSRAGYDFYTVTLALSQIDITQDPQWFSQMFFKSCRVLCFVTHVNCPYTANTICRTLYMFVVVQCAVLYLMGHGTTLQTLYQMSQQIPNIFHNYSIWIKNRNTFRFLVDLGGGLLADPQLNLSVNNITATHWKQGSSILELLSR